MAVVLSLKPVNVNADVSRFDWRNLAVPRFSFVSDQGIIRGLLVFVLALQWNSRSMKRKKKIIPEQRRKPTQARAQATVATILEAAARILRTKGRAAFNTNRIAERAGISIGTLYGYFPDKDSIYIALARRIVEEDGQALLEILDGDHGTETIRVLIRTLLERHLVDRDVRRTVMSYYVASGFAAEHDGLVEEIVQRLSKQADRVFGRDITKIDPIRLFVISRAVIGIARGLTEQLESRDLPLERLEDETVRFVREYLL